ncbi:serine hydrolase [Paenibacillus marinisediminis]
MKKKRLYILSGILLVCIAVVWFLVTNLTSTNTDYVVDYINKNPDKVSLSIKYNDDTLVDYNADRVMPLASAAHVLVAIEYAEQAAEGIISSDEYVKISDLNRYYIPKFDGGAQEAWIESMRSKNLVKDEAITLEEVAKGMILYGSNTNMEYLMDRLGLDKINENITLLGLKNFSPLHYFNSSLLVPYELAGSNADLTDKVQLDAVTEQIRSMTSEEFAALSETVHQHLKNDNSGSYLESSKLEDWYNTDLDRINSDRMGAGTTADYVIILEKLNSSDYFSAEAKKHLEAILEIAMQNPTNQETFVHMGNIGGYTQYILNNAVYAEDKSGNRIEIALFMNDVKATDYNNIIKRLNSFFNEILVNPEFRNELTNTFTK